MGIIFTLGLPRSSWEGGENIRIARKMKMHSMIRIDPRIHFNDDDGFKLLVYPDTCLPMTDISKLDELSTSSTCP
jgi:hypothetical protein